MLRLGPPETF